MRDPVSRRATRYGVALGLVNGAVQFGLAIATHPQSNAQADSGAAFMLIVLLLVLGNVALIVSLGLLLQLGYALCRRGEVVGSAVGAGIQAGFLAGALVGLGAVLGLFVAIARRHSNPLTPPDIAGSLIGVLLFAFMGAGLGVGLAAIGAAFGRRRYQRVPAAHR